MNKRVTFALLATLWLTTQLNAQTITAKHGRSAAPAGFNASFTVDVSGFEFFDGEGSPNNTVFTVDLGTMAGMPGMDVTLVGAGWDLTLTTNTPSWGSEAFFGLDYDADLTNDLYLQPSETDDPVAGQALSTGGIINFGDIGVSDGLIVGGVLTIEMFDIFDDFPGAADAFLGAGSELMFRLAGGSIDVCDLNGDTRCNGVDINLLIPEILSGNNNPDFDVNGDTLVNADDQTAWLAEAGAVNLTSGNSYIEGDANLDGTVDGLDFLEWNENKFTNSTDWTGGNFNVDAVTDGLDFLVWNDNKFTSADNNQAVPEPTAVMLLLVGCAAALRRARR